MIGRWLHRARPLSQRAQALLEAERSIEQQPADVRERGTQRAISAVKRERGSTLAVRSGEAREARIVPLSAAVASQRLADLQKETSHSGIFRAPRFGGLSTFRRAYVAAAVLVLAGFAGAAIGISEYNKTQNSMPALEEDEPSKLRQQHRRSLPLEGSNSSEPEPLEVVEPSALPRAEPLKAPPAAPVAPTQLPPKRQDYLRELAMLQPAREAVARGHHGEALRVVAKHQTSFPNSQLRQEREALRIRALWGTGRRNDALKASKDFKKQYPRSVLLSWMKQEVEPEQD